VIAGYLPYTVIVRPGALGGAALLARIYASLTNLALAALGLVLLLTPTGSAPSPGWRRWGFASAAAMAALAVAATVAPGSVDAPTLAVEGPSALAPSAAPSRSSTSSPWSWPSSSSSVGPARW
jgi:hypothetical protein